MTTPTNLPVGATAISDRATGNEIKPNADGSINVGQMAGSDFVPSGSSTLVVLGVGTSSNNLNRLYEVHQIGDGGDTNFFPVGQMLYNDASTKWYRQRGNVDTISLVPSAAYTSTQTVADQINYNHRGVVVVLDMTVVGTGSVTLTIKGKDPVSGKYYTILAGAAVTTNSTNVYRVYPGLTAAANATASDVLPRTWQVIVTANNANSATYSVGAMLIL